MKYSKNKWVNKLVTTKAGDTREYRILKIGAMGVAKEGFKLISAIMPSIGTGFDAIQHKNGQDSDIFDQEQSHTCGAMLQLLSENISDEHFIDLAEKLMGRMYVNGVEVKDLDDHFDEFNGDFLDILSWIFMENFRNFITESDMLASLMTKLISLLNPSQLETLKNFKSKLDTDHNS